MLNLSLPTLIARIIIMLISLTVHEFSHAWTADRFGDNTPAVNGRLTLNPLRHLDPIGSLLILIAGFGWARPVPINPYVLRRRMPSAVMWVSLAGPLSNLVLAILAGLVWRLTRFAGLPALPAWLPSLPQFLLEFIWINLALMIFNLIPLAPLDGEKVFGYFLPSSFARSMETIRPYGPLILMAIVFVGPWVGVDVIGWLLGPPINAIMKVLIGVSA